MVKGLECQAKIEKYYLKFYGIIYWPLNSQYDPGSSLNFIILEGPGERVS